MRILSALSLSFAGVLTWSCSSTSGGGGSAADDGGPSRDATPTQDATASSDASDPTDGADDASVDPPGPSACVSDSGAASVADFASAPTCASGSCTLLGTIDGTSISATFPVSKFDFLNGIQFDAAFGTGGGVQLEMEGVTLIAGGTTTTLGTLVTPDDGPAPGTHLCLGDGTRLELLVGDAGQTVRFIAHCLSGSCTIASAPVVGDLAGCCAR